jgi:hypothetical protein
MSGVGKGHHGTSMGGVERSPERQRREAERRRRQEASWARKAGPAVTRSVESLTPEERVRYGFDEFSPD